MGGISNFERSGAVYGGFVKFIVDILWLDHYLKVPMSGYGWKPMLGHWKSEGVEVDSHVFFMYDFEISWKCANSLVLQRVFAF